MQRLVLVALLCLLPVSIVGQESPRPVRLPFRVAPSTPQPTKAGWWIRVNEASTATQITFTFSATPKAASDRFDWAQSRPKEFDVTGAFQSGESLHIVAAAGQPASLCVFYKDQGVERLEFKDKAEAQLHQKKKAQDCTP